MAGLFHRGGSAWCKSGFRGCDGSFAFCLSCDACSLRCCGSGRILVSWCMWLVFVSAVHPVAMRKAVF